ncbi:MAG: hypothetical protein M4579_000565 [Chaenotheca gracillima]|nr:MAG: hypothetical protein M4579_000565 [Chaenotheca gracillima]
MDDRDVMAVDPTPASSAVPRETSSEPCGPRRDSIEDADASLTRKRQRLDGTPRPSRSMSADRDPALPDAPSHAGMETAAIHPAGIKATLRDTDDEVVGTTESAASPQTPDELRDDVDSSHFQQTPSRVTINVRPPKPGSVPAESPKANFPTLEAAYDESDTFDEPAAVSENNAVSSPQASSHERSPEVEAAEVEDMDQDYETKWAPAVFLQEEDSGIQQRQVEERSLIEEFPYFDGLVDAKPLMRQFAGTLEREPIDGKVIEDLKDWLVLCLQRSEQKESNFYDVFHEHAPFWEDLPCLIEGLFKRRVPFGGDFLPSREPDTLASDQRDLEEFLCNFAVLSRHFMLADVATFKRITNNEDDPDLISFTYQYATSCCLLGAYSNDASLWQVLKRYHGVNIDELAAKVVMSFVGPKCEGLVGLCEFTRLLYERTPQHPSLSARGPSSFWVALRLLGTVRMVKPEHADDPNASAIWHRVPRDIAASARQIHTQLESVVEKQGSVPRDYIKDSYVFLYHLLMEICTTDRTVAIELFQERGGQLEDAESEDLPELASMAWKLAMLKKCITAGRMEVRVQALDALGEELVNHWQKSGAQSFHHPVMQYLAKFILDNKLVAYLVGVDSHLQLIERTPNVVGFLVVTEKYTCHESDIIWQAVKASQDPRITTALLGVFKGIFGMANYATLMYLCEKLHELPLQAFDVHMIDYCANLFSKVKERLRNTLQKHLDIPPYDLCLRLVRQATASEGYPQIATSAVAQFGLRQFEELLTWGPEIHERRRILDESVKDIADKAPEATGSICAINVMLRHAQPTENGVNELALLTSESDLTRLLIDEFTELIRSARSRGVHFLNAKAIMQPRLELLSEIITKVPQTITSELGDQLWTYLLGDEAFGLEVPELGWAMLCAVVARLNTSNSFLDRCIQDKLPNVRPALFGVGLLNFTQRAIDYETRLRPPQAAAEHEIIEVPETEQVWRIILTAPTDTIELRAIQLLVSLYLDAHITQKAPRSATEATHLALVDRCVRQLASAAANLKSSNTSDLAEQDEMMDVATPDSDVEAQELKMSRSLLFLREILGGLRSRCQYSPKLPRSPNSPKLLPPPENQHGEPIRIKYQAFSISGRSQPAMKEFEIGDLETCAGFKQHVTAVTGYANFITIVSGFSMDLDESPDKQLREMKLGPNPFMMFKKTVDSTDTAVEGSGSEGLTIVEIELLKHFDELYDLLGLQEKLASEVWEFLNTFPPQEKLRKLVSSPASTSADIFPDGLPFKIIYSATTLQTCFEEQLKKGIVNEAFILHSVKVLVSALLNDDLLETTTNERLRIKTQCALIKCLLCFLKEPVDPATSMSYFEDEERLLHHLLEVLDLTRPSTTWALEDATSLACNTFSTILEASLHSASFWKLFASHQGVLKTIQQLLLDDARSQCPFFEVETRPQAHFNLCTRNSAAKVSADEFASTFWRALSLILPEATKNPASSTQLFDASLTVFRAVGESLKDQVDFDAYIRDWGTILLEHKSQEIVGKEIVDNVVYGFTNLLHWCVQLAKSLKKPVNTGDLPERLFARYLFPDFSTEDANGLVQETVPILHPQLRRAINELVLVSIQDTRSLKRILDFVNDISNNEVTYDVPFHFTRSKAIRSSTGYVGLINLGNTCYLNSLLTQLFMNVKFRGFMLGANVADAEGSQKLLSETQKFFAYMQDSWQVAVEPKDLVSAIRPYEADEIDTGIQMDVEEFYNLLFDRWEGQILSNDAKKTFRSFFGGQLVQQVKSKECDHISEREEPFSAIQCDIKGKANLEQSLKAYVEGDMMEGDNKYSCTSCGRHVDAVKRTCLKDVPDHLIFHLKRFDFDLRTMQRIKINDLFEFPSMLDMKPYTVDYLSNGESPASSDMFELVGVLVHSGTADSGHYYSFIRERPITNLSQSPGWVHFNDSEVRAWDPSNIPSQCFGGRDTWTQNRDPTPLHLPKSYNAYMLFYQRSSSLSADQQSQSSQLSVSPKKLPVPLNLRNHIATDNEFFIRKYCLYDPNQAPFVRSLLDLMRILNKGFCSEDHELERTAITVALHHFDQVISKTKDVPDFDAMKISIYRVIGSCTTCCAIFLDLLGTRLEIIRDMLIRCPISRIRQDLSQMIVTALQFLKAKDSPDYGIEPPNIDQVDSDRTGCFQQIVTVLEDSSVVIDVFQRAWDDYFGLLCQLSSLGRNEAAEILRQGLLRKCLEILVVEYAPGLRKKYEKMIQQLSKGKRASYTKLIQLTRVLLEYIDLTNETHAEDEDDRFHHEDPGTYSLTKTEERLFRIQPNRPRRIAFVAKMVDTNHNPSDTRMIVAQIVKAEPHLALMPAIVKMLQSCITLDPASLAEPYLSAAIPFCEFSPALRLVLDFITSVAREVDTIGGNGGQEHLSFFQDLAITRNERVPESPDAIHFKVVELVPLWATPLLLYWDPVIRLDTERTLHRLIFHPPGDVEDLDTEQRDIIEKAIRDLGNDILKKLHERYHVTNSQIDSRMYDIAARILDECLPYHAHEPEGIFMTNFNCKGYL